MVNGVLREGAAIDVTDETRTSRNKLLDDAVQQAIRKKR